MTFWNSGELADGYRNEGVTDAEEACSVDEAIEVIREEVGDFDPEVMVVFGSGLSDAIHPIEIYHTIPYKRIPGLTAPSAAGHPGKLGFGVWQSRRVLAFQGRLHWHEGHSWKRVTLPVLIAAEMGVSICIFTNMSGAVNPRIKPGSLVAIDDHMNFMGSNPLVGTTANDPTTMFPDMGEAYSLRLRRLLDEAARINGLPLAHGVYVGVSGPNYETPAEVRALRLLGADVVGMSTVGEVLVARQCALECCALSCVANPAGGVDAAPIRHDDVLKVARETCFQLATLIDTFMRIL